MFQRPFRWWDRSGQGWFKQKHSTDLFTWQYSTTLKRYSVELKRSRYVGPKPTTVFVQWFWLGACCDDGNEQNCPVAVWLFEAYLLYVDYIYIMKRLVLLHYLFKELYYLFQVTILEDLMKLKDLDNSKVVRTLSFRPSRSGRRFLHHYFYLQYFPGRCSNVCGPVLHSWCTQNSY